MKSALLVISGFLSLRNVMTSSFVENDSEFSSEMSIEPQHAQQNSLLSKLNEELMTNFVENDVKLQGALLQTCRSYSKMIDESKPFQSRLARNFNMPAFKNVSLHLDLEALDDFIVDDSREGKLQALIFLRTHLTHIIDTSPIYEDIKTIFFEELYAFAENGMTESEFMAFDQNNQKRRACATFQDFLEYYFAAGQVEKIYKVMKACQEEVDFSPVFVTRISFLKPAEEVDTFTKMVAFLQQDPSRFSVFYGRRFDAALAVLMSLPSGAQILLDAISAEGALNALLYSQFGGAIAKLSKGLLLKHASIKTIHEQVKIFLDLVSSIEDIKEWRPPASADYLVNFLIFLDIRFNPEITSACQLELNNLDRSIIEYFAEAAILAGKYQLAMELFPENPRETFLHFCAENRGFFLHLAARRPLNWMLSKFDDYRYLIWQDRDMVLAFYKVDSIKKAFKAAGLKAVSEKYAKYVFENGSLEEISEFLNASANLSLGANRHNYMELLRLRSLSDERFVMCAKLLTRFGLLDQKHYLNSGIELAITLNRISLLMNDEELKNDLMARPFAVTLELQPVCLRKVLYRGIEMILFLLENPSLYPKPDSWNFNQFFPRTPTEVERMPQLYSNSFLCTSDYFSGQLKYQLDDLFEKDLAGRSIESYFIIEALYSGWLKLNPSFRQASLDQLKEQAESIEIPSHMQRLLAFYTPQRQKLFYGALLFE